MTEIISMFRHFIEIGDWPAVILCAMGPTAVAVDIGAFITVWRRT